MGINRRRPAPSWYSLKNLLRVLHRRPSECHDLPKQRAYEHRGRMCARPCPGQAHASGGLTVVMLRGQIVLLWIVLFLFLAASFAIAQGGPPYYTNDPGTPGNLNWEINFGYMPFLYSDSLFLTHPMSTSTSAWRSHSADVRERMAACEGLLFPGQIWLGAIESRRQMAFP